MTELYVNRAFSSVGVRLGGLVGIAQFVGLIPDGVVVDLLLA